MSRFQKLVLSILGTILGHLLLVVIIAMLLAISDTMHPPVADAAAEPEEMTILLADLMENIPKDSV